jgi:hypothetical protein
VFYHAGGDVLDVIKSGKTFHVGTEASAVERVSRPVEGGQLRTVHQVEINVKTPYLVNDEILDERTDDGRTELFIIQNMKSRQEELVAAGYDAVPYINAVEDVGSLSYMILIPDAVRVTGKKTAGKTSYAGKWQPQVAPAERQIEERQKLHENNARTLYHVTDKKHVPKIRREGLVPMQTSNWVMGDDSRYGRGEIYAFESRKDAIKWGFKMEWEFYQELGGGNIYLISLLEKGEWEVDESDPISQAGAEGKWLKKMEHVPPSDIIDFQPITKELMGVAR